MNLIHFITLFRPTTPPQSCAQVVMFPQSRARECMVRQAMVDRARYYELSELDTASVIACAVSQIKNGRSAYWAIETASARARALSSQSRPYTYGGPGERA